MLFRKDLSLKAQEKYTKKEAAQEAKKEEAPKADAAPAAEAKKEEAPKKEKK